MLKGMSMKEFYSLDINKRDFILIQLNREVEEQQKAMEKAKNKR